MIYKDQDLKQIRKDIKLLGFNFRKKNYSDFTYIEFYHIRSKRLYPDIFTPDTIILFKDLINYIKNKGL